MDDNATLLSVFLPRALLAALMRGSGAGQVAMRESLEGAALAADISGFTAMSERLAARGPSGAEEIGRLLNDLYGGFVDEVHGRGGDVVRFVGDMLVAVWPAHTNGGLKEATAQAAAAALAIQSRRPPAEPGEEVFTVRVGVGAGRLALLAVGGVMDRWEALVVGDALLSALSAQNRAKPGTSVLADSALALLGKEVSSAPHQGGGATLLAAPATGALQLAPPPAIGGDQAHLVRAFVPGAVRSRLDVGLSRWLAELRTVSVIFVRLLDLDASEQVRLDELQALTRALQQELYRFEGALDKFAVDEKGVAILGAFGLPPFSHEDDPVRAVRAGLAVTEAAAALGHRCAIGVSTGRVFCGTLGSTTRCEYTMLGGTVNLAARLMTLAAEGELLCDEATAHAAGERLIFEARSPATLKGFREPVPVYRPVGLRGREELAQGSLVGRDEQLAALDGLLDRSGRGAQAILLIEGAPGIGKSALLAVSARKASALKLRHFGAAGDAIERLTPYHAWRPIFAELLAFRGPDSRAAARERYSEALGESPLADYAALIEVVVPLGLDEPELVARLGPEARAERTRALLCLLLGWAMADGPALLVADDLQWFDSPSWALLEAVSTSVQKLSMILSCRAIPDERAGLVGRLLAVDGARRLSLGPLSDEASRALLMELLGLDLPPDHVLGVIIERAEGNPFYLAELARSMAVEIGPGHSGFGWDSAHPTTVPTTLEGAVTSRIDRLAPEDQLLLKVISVFGRPVGAADLAGVLPLSMAPSEVAARLDQLLAGEWLRRQVEGPRWAFASALVRDAAYGLMTFAQRKSLHAAVAATLERSSVGVDLPVLAFHWTRANVVDKAVLALERAGEEAARNFALEEVNRFFGKALELMPDAPAERRFRWNLALGSSRLRVGLPTEAQSWLLRALAAKGISVPSGRRALAWAALRGMLAGLLGLRPRGRSREESQEESRVWLELGWAEYFRLELLGALHAMLRAHASARALGPSYELAVSAASLSAYATLLGLSRISAVHADRALHAIADGSDPAAAGTTLGVLGVEALTRADWPAARERLERARVQDAVAGLREDQDLADIYLAILAHAQGALPEARALAAEARRRGDLRGSPIVRVRARFTAAAAALAVGMAREAARQLEEAAQIGREAGEGLDAASALMARLAAGVGALLSGRAADAARVGVSLRGDVRLGIAATSPTSRVGDLLALLLICTWESAPAGEDRAPLRAEARRLVGNLRQRGRIAPMLRPVAARWEGRCLLIEGRERAARRVWRAGLAQARAHGLRWEEAMLLAELSRFGDAAMRAKAESQLRAQGAAADEVLEAYRIP